jgi:hypothetical protein
VSLHRGIDGSDPVRLEPVARLDGTYELRRSEVPWRLGAGTLACPRCDAPVDPGAAPLAPPDPLGCPFCDHGGAVRDFLSLGAPTRPARVEVRVIPRPR